MCCSNIIDHQNIGVANIELAIDDNKVCPTRAAHTLAFRKLKGAFKDVLVWIGLDES